MKKHLAPTVIAELLRKLMVGTNPETNGPWPVFVSQLPLDPDNAISIMDNSVPTQGRLHKTGLTIAPEGFQLRVRSTDYRTGELKILEIKQHFDNVRRMKLPVEEKLYLIQGIHQLQTPTYMGADPNNRYSFVFNCITNIYEA